MSTSPYFDKLLGTGEPSRKRICKSPPSPVISSTIVKTRLDDLFFNQECSALAQALLGKVLVRCFDNNEVVSGRIVETEAYLGLTDKASHSSYKRTERNEPMFMKAGTIYIYSIYGMYHCFNISSGGEGVAVLLRAIEPLSGLDQMQQIRSLRQKTIKDRILPAHQLCNGPSKLCLSYGITKDLNKMDIASPSSPIWIEDWKPQPSFNINTSTRIGLGKKAGEWTTAPLRFYVLNSKSVSVIDRLKEKKLKITV